MGKKQKKRPIIMGDVITLRLDKESESMIDAEEERQISQGKTFNKSKYIRQRIKDQGTIKN